jgi:tRNA-binding protein
LNSILYQKEDLINKLILAVKNFLPRQIADFMSEVLVLGVMLDNSEVVLIKPDTDVDLGKRIL